MKNKISPAFIFIFVIILFINSNYSFSLNAENQENELKKISEVENASELNNFYNKYELPKINYSDEIKYNLPIDKNKISNLYIYNDLNKNSKLTDKICKNGFVVIPTKQEYMHNLYSNDKQTNKANFITSDSLLHVYHINFDNLLKNIEENIFYNYITKMMDLLIKKHQLFLEKYPIFKNEINNNIAFLSVAYKILSPDFKIPKDVESIVKQELEYIEAHSGFNRSPIFKYKEDYSQYVPRGHYTRTEKLKKYFKAVMWLGRIGFLINDGIVNKKTANMQTHQAIIMIRLMETIKIDDESLISIWEKMYKTINFFVGKCDDLTIYEYKKSLKTVGKNLHEINKHLNNNDYTKLVDMLNKLDKSKIYAGTGDVKAVIEENNKNKDKIEKELGKAMNSAAGFRFFGQRYTPDAYTFQKLIFPSVSLYKGNTKKLPFTASIYKDPPMIARGWGTGLDIMYILGSSTAYDIMKNSNDLAFANYDKQSEMVKNEFNKYSDKEWNQNLYYSWVYTLKALLNEEYDKLPSFCNNKAWKYKNVNTALASWAELKHDTILYSKQAYSMKATSTAVRPKPKPSIPKGFVEPNPVFYSRLFALNEMTLNGLKELGLLPQYNEMILDSFSDTLEKLIEISIKELEAKTLSDNDYKFIKNFNVKSFYPYEIPESEENGEYAIASQSEKGTETMMIADVLTNSNEEKCLEVAVGYVNKIFVAYYIPEDNEIVVGSGPSFSYYEFKHSINDRLTDEKWKVMLKNNKNPNSPKWTEEFIIK